MLKMMIIRGVARWIWRQDWFWKFFWIMSALFIVAVMLTSL